MRGLSYFSTARKTSIRGRHEHRRDDFTRGQEPYDLILDLVAHRSVFAYRRALALCTNAVDSRYLDRRLAEVTAQPK